MMAKSEKYDPFSVLKSAESAKRQREADVAKARAIGAAWDAAMSKSDAEKILAIAAILRDTNDQIWADYLGCSIAREKMLADSRDPDRSSSDPSFALRTLAIRLFILATNAANESFQAELKRMPQGAFEEFALISEAVEEWSRYRHPPFTPMMTAEELFDACGGKIEGFSKPQISKGISGKLDKRPAIKIGKEQYRQFFYRPAQREVLSHVVPFLKKSEKNSFIFSEEREPKTSKARR